MVEINEAIKRPLGVTFIGFLFIVLATLGVIELSILLIMFVQITYEAPYWALLFWYLGFQGWGSLLLGSGTLLMVLNTIQLGQSFPFIAIILGITTFFNLAIANGLLEMRIYAYTFGFRFTVLLIAINTVIVFFYWSLNLYLITYVMSLISVIICLIILYYFPKLVKQEYT